MVKWGRTDPNNNPITIILCLTQTIYAKKFHIADGRELFLAFSEASNNVEDDIIYLAAENCPLMK